MKLDKSGFSKLQRVVEQVAYDLAETNAIAGYRPRYIRVDHGRKIDVTGARTLGEQARNVLDDLVDDDLPAFQFELTGFDFREI